MVISIYVNMYYNNFVQNYGLIFFYKKMFDQGIILLFWSSINIQISTLIVVVFELNFIRIKY